MMMLKRFLFIGLLILKNDCDLVKIILLSFLTVPALALINHLCDTTERRISEASLLRALAYSEYLESHAMRIYSHGTQPGIDAAKALLTKLKNNKLSNPFSARDVYKNHWAGLDNPQKAQTAIDVLLDYSHLLKEETATDGRPTTQYHWVKS
jgi:hypothetical protein